MTYATNKEYFNIPTIENSYWAGFLAADGCLWKRGDAVGIIYIVSLVVEQNA